MICTIPIHEFNPCHNPGGPGGGQFCATTSGAEILRGVDSAANAERLIIRAENFRLRFGDRDPKRVQEEIALTEAALRSLPLIHGTSVEGAVGAITEGLKSNAGMEARRKELADDIDDLKKDIVQAMGKDPSVARLQLPQVLDSGPDPYNLQNAFGLDRAAAEKVSALMMDLEDISDVVNGTTHPADAALGLDQFVFLTHGAKHQDYGRVGVVVDNSVAEWATPKDIVSVTTTVEDNDSVYDPFGVEEYQETIVKGDDYYKAAAATTGTLTALIHRSRDQMWEVKASSIPKSKVLGFVVYDDLDMAIRLSKRLQEHGITGKVMYFDTSDSHYARRQYLQLKHLQRWHSWNSDLTAKWFDSDGYGAVLLID